MNLLAGFDTVIEISRRGLQKLVDSQLRVGGRTLSTPFEFDLDKSFPIITGHVIVDSVTLTVNANDTLTLDFHFVNTAVSIEPAPGTWISNLAGNWLLTAPLADAGNATQFSPALNLAAATGSLTFSPASQATLNGVLPAGVTIATVASVATQALLKYAQNNTTNGLSPLGVTFALDATQDGTIQPPRFVRAEVHCIAPGPPSQSALAIYGIIFKANAQNGTPSLKTATAVPEYKEVAISVSPEVFHRLAFCPALARKLDLLDANMNPDVSLLPPPCGNSSGVPVKDGKLTEIGDLFFDGTGLVYYGKIQIKKFCVTINVDFWGFISFTETATGFVPVAVPQPPVLDAEVEWYCQMAIFFFVMGPFLAAEKQVLETLTESYAFEAVDDGIKEKIAGTLGNAVSFPKVTLNRASANKQGLTLAGDIEVTLPAPRKPSVSLFVSSWTISTNQNSTGTFTHTTCPKGDFPYIEYLQPQRIYVKLTPTLLGRPLKIEWTLSSATETIKLPPTTVETNISLTSATRLPLPMPAGMTFNTALNLRYKADQDWIYVFNTPADGNFELWLEAKVTDPAGNVVIEGTQLAFEGDIVEIGGGFQEKFEDCIQALMERLEKNGFESEWGDIRIPPWVLASDPRPEALGPLIHALTRLDVHEAEHALGALKLAHGNRFDLALSRTLHLQPQKGWAVTGPGKRKAPRIKGGTHR